MNGEETYGGRECPIFPLLGARAVVLCDGPPPPEGLLEYWLDGAGTFICADGAGHPFSELPRQPDLVIGDMDSLRGRLLDGRDGPRFLRDPDQTTTDSEKALIYLADEGYDEVILLGGVGWRLDHTVYNCFLLEKFAPRLRICLAGYNSGVVRLGAQDVAVWNLPEGTAFSLLPLFGPVGGVNLKGSLFDLDEARLQAGGFSTISNEVADPPLRLQLESGSLLVTVERKSWFEA